MVIYMQISGEGLVRYPFSICDLWQPQERKHRNMPSDFAEMGDINFPNL